MRGKQLWGTLLATWTVLIPGLAFGQEPTYNQGATEYAPPDTIFPLPLSSTRPEAGGLFVSGGFWFERQTNPIKDQLVAVRGFTATSNDVLGRPGTIGQFIGSAAPALNVQQIAGPNSYQPGYTIDLGWKFGNGSALTFTFRQLTQTHYAAVATLFPQDLQLGVQYENTFLSAPVFNYPNDFAGPLLKVTSLVGSISTTTQVINPITGMIETVNVLPPGFLTLGTQLGPDVQGGAIGIWNGAATMQIDLIQRFTDYYATYRSPVLDTECYRLNGTMGPRATWIYERFKWRTVSMDTSGNAAPQDVAVYTNVTSNYMYGAFVGCEQEWYCGHGVALMLDTRATGYVNIVKERAKYQLGDKEYFFSVANKRARKDYTFVPQVEVAANLMWYPIEGVQIKLGYNVMAFFNTIASPRPIAFDYSGLDPAYESTFRLFDGFQASLALSF